MPASSNSSAQLTNDIPPAYATSAEQVVGTTTSVKIMAEVVGYTDVQGNPISESQALKLQQQGGVSTQSDNIPSTLACKAGVSVRAYSFSSNAYGRIQFDCAEIGGKFDSIGYATVRITDPGGSYADGYKVSGTGSQHAEVLSGAVNKINGRYVVQGTLQANYSKPSGQYTRTVYQLETRPLEAQNLTW